jgi:threonine/homoserine/homoserine lactone efflux protein
MLLPTIGDLLPASAAIALSPFPIVAVVVVLGTDRARSNGVAFAAGWTVGLAAVTALVTVLTDAGSGDDAAPSTAVGVVRVLVGSAFLAMAVKTWRNRPAPGTDPELPGWMASLDDLAPGRALGLGAALSGLNPKIVALVVAGATTIGAAGLDATEAVLATVAFVAIGSCTVVGAVGAHLVAGERVAGPLRSVQRFMVANNTAIMLVVLVVMGAKVLGDGITTLTL